MRIGARGETRTHDTGFAIQRLGRLATRAIWNGRRDSNSRVEFGRLACFQLHHFRVICVIRVEHRLSECKFGTPGRIRTRSIDVRSVVLFQLSYRSLRNSWCTVPDSNRCLSVGNAASLPTGPTVPGEMVGEDRIELSPRVPKTRMLALHHTPKIWCAR